MFIPPTGQPMFSAILASGYPESVFTTCAGHSPIVLDPAMFLLLREEMLCISASCADNAISTMQRSGKSLFTPLVVREVTRPCFSLLSQQQLFFLSSPTYIPTAGA